MCWCTHRFVCRSAVVVVFMNLLLIINKWKYIYLSRCGWHVFTISLPTSMDLAFVSWLINNAERYNYCSCSLHTRRRHNRHHGRHRRRNRRHMSVINFDGRPNRHRHNTDVVNVHWVGEQCINDDTRNVQHSLINRMWRHLRPFLETTTKSWLCRHSVESLEETCLCFNALHGRSHFCACSEITSEILYQCLWYKCNSFLQEHVEYTAVRPSWRLLTTWQCNNVDVEGDTNWYWPRSEHDDRHNAISWNCSSRGCSWQNDDDICRCRRRINGIIVCHCTDATCIWPPSSLNGQMWRCRSNPNVLTQCHCQGHSNSGAKACECQHTIGNCQWECSVSNGESSCQWPLGPTLTAVEKWFTGADTSSRWQCPTQASAEKLCHCTETNDPSSRSCACGIVSRTRNSSSYSSCNWQSLTSDMMTSITWQCHSNSTVPIGNSELCSCRGTSGLPSGYWQCRSIDPTWQCQGLTADGNIWQEVGPAAVPWPWQQTCRCPLTSCQCRHTIGLNALCLCHPEGHNWQCSPISP